MIARGRAAVVMDSEYRAGRCRRRALADRSRGHVGKIVLRVNDRSRCRNRRLPCNAELTAIRCPQRIDGSFNARRPLTFGKPVSGGIGLSIQNLAAGGNPQPPPGTGDFEKPFSRTSPQQLLFTVPIPPPIPHRTGSSTASCRRQSRITSSPQRRGARSWVRQMRASWIRPSLQVMVIWSRGKARVGLQKRVLDHAGGQGQRRGRPARKARGSSMPSKACRAVAIIVARRQARTAPVLFPLVEGQARTAHDIGHRRRLGRASGRARPCGSSEASRPHTAAKARAA